MGPKTPKPRLARQAHGPGPRRSARGAAALSLLLTLACSAQASDAQPIGAPAVLWLQTLEASALPKGLEALPQHEDALATGYCLPRSGDHPGHPLLLWQRFPSVSETLAARETLPSLGPAETQAGVYTELGVQGLTAGYARRWRVTVGSEDFSAFLDALAQLEAAIQQDGHRFRAVVLSPAGPGAREAGQLQLWALSPNAAAAGAIIDAYYQGAPWAGAWDAAYGYFNAISEDQFLSCHPLPLDPR